MNNLDILYTPLDTPLVPKFDLLKLESWIGDNFARQQIADRRDGSKIDAISNMYPWKLIYAREQDNWCADFDKLFPDLAQFFYSAYGLDEDDINNVIMLPVKPQFKGVGFWHSDVDSYGLRMYLVNDEVDDFLLMKSTAEPYLERPAFGLDFKDIKFKEEILSPKLFAPNQTFYLNNTRSIHAVNVQNPGVLRMALIVSPKYKKSIEQHLNNLIVRSAEKFKDYAIYY
jgi:hypothetical protein